MYENDVYSQDPNMTLRSYIGANPENMNTKIFLKIFNEFRQHND